MTDEELTPRVIRYNLIRALIDDRGTMHDPDSLIKIMESYYKAIVALDGEIVEFQIYED